MRAIKVTYRGPTDHGPSKLIASDMDGNRCSLSYQEAQDRAGNKTIFDDAPFRKTAEELCALAGWDPLALMGAQLDKNTWVYLRP